MFEDDVVNWDAAATLAGAARAKTQANECEVERLICAAHFADLYPSSSMIPGDKTLPGRERSMIYGGPGCPGVAEFAVAEYAVVMGVSVESAAKDIGQALCLRHRLPRTWAAVMARTATAWKARLIATECLPLSLEAAAIVDRKIARIIDTVTPHQLKNIVKAAIWEADPEAARAKAEQRARERGVWIARSDDHGTTTMFIKAATGSILRLYATITQLADALAAIDPEAATHSLDHRRAQAIELLSDPALAHKLLQVAQHLATHPGISPANAAADASADGTTTAASTAGTAPADSDAAAASASVATTAGASAEASADDAAAADSVATDAAAETRVAAPCDDAAAMSATEAALPANDAIHIAPAPTDRPAHTQRPQANHPQPDRAAEVSDPTAPNHSCTEQPARSDQPAEANSPAPAADDPGRSDTTIAETAAPRSADNTAHDNPGATPTDTDDTEPEVTRDGELASELFLVDEPTTHTEADRDTPHPSQPGHPLDPSPPPRPPGQAESPHLKELIYGLGTAGRRNLAEKLAAIKHAADTTRTGKGATGIARTRPGRTKLYIHLTDETLLAGGGITRVEGFGPALATKLAELLGHDHITVQPVIDLNNHLNVNSYEIPQRLREHIKLIYPVEQFPYGPGETTTKTDLDHITPFDPTGPPGQTSTQNLQPLRRISHRIKTHAPGWTVNRIDDHTIEWTTPHGYTFRVDNTGTHQVSAPPDRIERTGRDQP